jgi:hypothetical protein
MQILDSIREQITASRLPLVAVTVASVPCPDTPIILTLHWHGFVTERLVAAEDANVVALTPLPSTSLQINERWNDLLDLDMAAMEAGWELGAWDVVRCERRGCMRPGASAREAVDCLAAFGASGAQIHGAEIVVSEAPDADELIKLAAQSGYLYWLFRPVHGGIWGEVSDDSTLEPDGKRMPHCPLAPVRPSGGGARRTVYQFGEHANRRLLI